MPMRKKRPDGTSIVTPEKMTQAEADEHLSQSSFLEISEHHNENSSAILEGTQRVLYADGNLTDGDDANSNLDINDGEESAASIGPVDKNESSESEMNVDEHSDDMMCDEGEETKSPPKMNIVLDTRNVKMILSSSSLKTVPEVNSCGALSSGQASVDQQFMSPDLLALKARKQTSSTSLNKLDARLNQLVGGGGFTKGPGFKQPRKGLPANKGFSLQLFQAVKELKETDDCDGTNSDEMVSQDMSEGTVPSVVGRRQKHQEVANETEEHLRKL